MSTVLRERILLVGVAPGRLEEYRERLVDENYSVSTCAPDVDAIGHIEELSPAVVVVDLSERDLASTDFLNRCRKAHPACGFVALTEAGSPARLSEAVSNGADLAAPAASAAEDLLALVERARQTGKAAQDAARFKSRAEAILSQARFDEIIGGHPSMQELLKKVAYVAQTRTNVLIIGESGTGKELIAAAVHQNSKRAAAPFVRLNCAALSESVLESELFGHERGAFTGALTRREGRFEKAHGGTLFLDEIGEVSSSVQVKLLRFLQEREFERVGGNETVRVDVRVVAATNKDLLHQVSEGRFREDLYYRLNVVRLTVPPLRARPSDILQLADHFLRRSATENEIEVQGFTEAAKQLLLSYPWPGNVRELQNTVEQAVVLTETGRVDVEDLPIRSEPRQSALRILIPGATMAEIERYAITETLKAVGGSTIKAAEMLGISRRTVQYRVREWGLFTRAAGDE